VLENGWVLGMVGGWGVLCFFRGVFVLEEGDENNENKEEYKNWEYGY